MNAKFFNLETKKPVYVQFNNNNNGFIQKWEHEQLTDYASNKFKELMLKYGTIINDSINKNSNLYSYVRQGFNFYTLDSNLIDNIIYTELCSNVDNYYTSLQISYTMRMFSYLRKNYINSSFVLLT